ncbi:hypothetical protein [Pleionea sediminis]|uniref:hypothetical protein n=1 Tax=Pleionea sediminis TaxID=2569479 RepID=UPI001186D836|nr:hypothetical protein [Pleionea sediminis]
MNFQEMKKRMCVVIGGLGLALLGSTGMASNVQIDESKVQILQESKGWQLMDVQNADLSLQADEKTFSRVYLISSLEGIESAPIDAAIKKELVLAHQQALKNDEEFFVAINADVAEQGLTALQEQDGNFMFPCKPGWVEESESFPRDFAFADSREFTIDLPIEGQDSAYIRTIADVNLSGMAEFTAFYEVKRSWLCVPYMFRYVRSEVRASADLHRAGFNIEGEIAADFNRVFESEMIKLIDQSWNFMVGPIPVVFNIEAPLSVGLETHAQHRESFSMDAAINGRLSARISCAPGSDCEEEHDFNFQYIGDGPYIDANAQAAARPYLDLKVEGSLYNSSAIGAWASAQPYITAKAWGYAGNTCGDADRDGVNENVYGATLDAGAGLHLFAGYDLLNIGDVFPIAEDLLDYIWWDYELEGKYAESFYHHLLFTDLLGNSTVLNPVMKSEINDKQVRLNYGMRACLPFVDALQMTVDWGDGTVQKMDYNLRGMDALVHEYDSPGVYTVVVSAGTDALGREYNRSSSMEVAIVERKTFWNWWSRFLTWLGWK